MADPGVSSRRRIQAGVEAVATPGTAVAAGAIWRGPADFIKDDSVKIRPVENVGYRTLTSRIYTPQVGASLVFPEAEATFEQAPWPFSASVSNVFSGAANGGTSNGFKYAYVLPVAADPSFRTYTIEAGDNQQAEEMEYAFCEEIKITGVANEGLKITSTWRGRQRTTTTFTTNLTPAAVEEILFNKGKLYIDAATIGSTQITHSWQGFELTIKPGLKAVPSGDGNLYFSFVKGVAPEVTGKVIFEHDATAVAEKALFAAGTCRKMRMEFTGSTTGFTGAGGTFPGRALRIDLAANIDSYEDGEQDGDDQVTINFTAVYDGALYFEATFCNLLATLF